MPLMPMISQAMPQAPSPPLHNYMVDVTRFATPPGHVPGVDVRNGPSWTSQLKGYLVGGTIVLSTGAVAKDSSGNSWTLAHFPAGLLYKSLMPQPVQAPGPVMTTGWVNMQFLTYQVPSVMPMMPQTLPPPPPQYGWVATNANALPDNVAALAWRIWNSYGQPQGTSMVMMPSLGQTPAPATATSGYVGAGGMMMAMPISISQAAPAGGGRMPPGPGPQLVPQVTVPWPSDVQKTIGGVQYLFKWHDVPIDEFAAHEPGQQVAAGWVSDHGGHVVLIPHLTVMTWGLLPPPTALPPTPPTVTSGMFG